MFLSLHPYNEGFVCTAEEALLPAEPTFILTTEITISDEGIHMFGTLRFNLPCGTGGSAIAIMTADIDKWGVVIQGAYVKLQMTCSPVKKGVEVFILEVRLC